MSERSFGFVKGEKKMRKISPATEEVNSSDAEIDSIVLEAFRRTDGGRGPQQQRERGSQDRSEATEKDRCVSRTKDLVRTRARH